MPRSNWEIISPQEGGVVQNLLRGGWYLLVLLLLVILSELLQPGMVKEIFDKLPFQHDIFSFWAAAWALCQGINPYDLAGIEHELSRRGLLVSALEPIYGLPYLFLFLAPWGKVSFMTFYYWWVFCTFGLLTIAASFLQQIVVNAAPSWRGKDTHTLVTLSTLFLLVVFPPFVYSAFKAPLMGVILLSVSIACYLISRESLSHSEAGFVGFLLALGSLKPHLIGYASIVVLVWCLRRRELRVPLATFVSYIILLVITHLAHPDLLSQYLVNFERPPLDHPVAAPANRVVDLFGVDPKLAFFTFTVLGVSFALYGAIRAPKSPKQFMMYLWCFFVPLSFLFIPYFWSYDMIFFLPAVMMIVFTYTTSSLKQLLIVWSLVVVSSWAFWETLYPFSHLWWYAPMVGGISAWHYTKWHSDYFCEGNDSRGD